MLTLANNVITQQAIGKLHREQVLNTNYFIHPPRKKIGGTDETMQEIRHREITKPSKQEILKNHTDEQGVAVRGGK